MDSLPPSALTKQVIFWGFVATTCGLFGVIFNTILLCFHLKQKKNTTVILHALINFSDMLISCLLWFVLPSIVNFPHPALFQSVFIRQLWYYLWVILQRVSIWLIGILSVLRCRSLLYPLRRGVSEKASISIVTMVTVILTMLFAVVPASYNTDVIYSFRLQRPNFIEETLVELMGFPGNHIYGALKYMFGYFTPFLPILISCCLSTWSLRKSLFSNSTRNSSIKASETIIILTILYLLFNILLAIDECNAILIAIGWLANRSIALYDHMAIDEKDPAFYIFIYNYMYTYSIAINSMLNGFVNVYRTNSVKEFIRCGYNKAVTTVRRSQIKENNRVIFMNSKFTVFENKANSSQITMQISGL